MQIKLKENRTHKKFIPEIIVVMAVLIILAYFMIPRFLAVQNINTPKNFPDPMFRTMVEKFMEVKPGGRFTALEAAYRSDSPKGLFGNGCNIVSIQGIEFFPDIQFLELKDNRITGADFSRNPKLRHLYLTKNQLTKIDLSKNTKLIDLSVQNNQLSELNLNAHSELLSLDCDYNQLRKLELSQCSKLFSLYCRSNQLNELDLENLSGLYVLTCSYNQLRELNLSKNYHLGYVDCSNNRLQSLLLPPYTQKTRSLESLNCSNNLLNELVLDIHPSFLELFAENNRFQSVPKLMYLPRLEYVNLKGNLLSEDDCEEIARLQERLGEVLYTDEGPKKEGFEFEPQANGVNIVCSTI